MDSMSKRVSRLPSQLFFGDRIINSSSAFLSSKNVIGILEPSDPECQTLVIFPKRIVNRLHELNEAETIDLFLFSKKVLDCAETFFNITMSMVIQDGENAGGGEQFCVHLVPKGLPMKLGKKDNETSVVNEARSRETVLELRKLLKEKIDTPN